MEYWYALYTKPHKERQVASYFSERDIEVYYPTTPAPRRRGRSDERPFFPCYLFVRADIEITGVWALRYAPGTRRVVTFGDKPARVDDRLIEAIRDKLGRAEVVDTRGEILKPGDRVVITAGPFKDVEALFDQRLSAQGRVRVLISLIERMTPVEMDSDAIRKTNKRSPSPRRTSE